MQTVKCDKCGTELHVGDYPFCPHGRGANSVIGDDIPGGLEIKHGLCNPDGTARRYDSKSAIAAEAKRRNMTNYVVHNPPRGTDKSPHTSRWI